MRKAFTLIELLVVIGIIAVLAGLLIPTLARARAASWTAKCISNKRQLGIGISLYGMDSTDRYPLNSGPFPQVIGRPNWCHGISSWILFPTDEMGDFDKTNLIGPLCQLAPYVGSSSSIFKCPADNYALNSQGGGGQLTRPISIAMNRFFGLDRQFDGTPSPKNGGTMVTYEKVSNIQRLSPSDAWIISDVHPDSMLDMFLDLDYDGTENSIKAVSWFRLASSLHGGGAALLFADNHVENHKWVVPSTRQPVKYQIDSFRSALKKSDDRDWRWFVTHAGERAKD